MLMLLSKFLLASDIKKNDFIANIYYLELRIKKNVSF